MMRKIEKILLIQPPYNLYKLEPKTVLPPLGLAYIAAILEKKGYEPRILDCLTEGFEEERAIDREYFEYGLSDEEIKKEVAKFSPQVVGLSCLFSTQAEQMHRVAKLIKEVGKDIFVVVGGAHPSVMPKETLADANIDFIVIGEGESVFCKLLQRLKEGENFSSLSSFAYRTDSQIVINPRTKFIENLDELPYPARHLLPMKKYFQINTPMGTVARRRPNTPLVTSRGCPARCIFCSIHTVWGRHFRPHSSGYVLNEIEHLIDTYGIREIQFCDDNLTFNYQRAKEIFEGMIQRKLDLLWTTPNGVALWCLDEKLIELMKKAGCYKISVAVESGDEEVLSKIIQKPVNLKKVKPLIEFMKKIGLDVDVFFIVGLPGETEEQIKRTLDFGLSLHVDNLAISIATPHPGTRMFQICKEKGYIPQNIELRHIRSRKMVIVTPGFTPNQLQRMVAWTNFISKLELLWRKPYAFYERVIKRLIKDPRFFFSLSLRTLQYIANPKLSEKNC